MKRKTRIAIYLILIFLMFLQIQFKVVESIWRAAESTLDRIAIKRVRYIAQVKNPEYRNLWLGVGVIQYPSDLITYSDLVYKLKPDVIIETGTNYGGLAIYLATLLEKVNPEGMVITIDINSERWDDRTSGSGKAPESLRKRILFIKGDSVSESVIDMVERHAQAKRGMVILDSLHNWEHVLKELKLYSKFVALNSYIIVNDTHLEIMDIMDMGSGRGPLTAVGEFLKTTNEFEIDTQLPRTVLSAAPFGFLRRIK